MSKLSKEEIEFITKCLNEGKLLPDIYRFIIPFESRKEYELTYEGKEREEDILADTMAVPLQPVKTFGNPKRDQRSYGAYEPRFKYNKLEECI